MEKKDFYKMTDEELTIEKKKLKNSRIFHATFIGLLVGILIYGIVSYILSPEKQNGVIIAILLPVFIIYKLVKNPNRNKDLEKVLKERNLN